MLYELEVSGEGNSPMGLNRVFDLLEDPRSITRIFTANSMGEDQWCDGLAGAKMGPARPTLCWQKIRETG